MYYCCHTYSVTHTIQAVSIIILSLYDQWHLMNACPRFVKMTLHWIECLAFKALRDPPPPQGSLFNSFPLPCIGGHVYPENIKLMFIFKVYEQSQLSMHNVSLNKRQQ